MNLTGETNNIGAEGATPRKLSGKRTVKIITLESRRKPHRRSKSLRYRVKNSTLPTIKFI
jgi:hypothetical protein